MVVAGRRPFDTVLVIANPTSGGMRPGLVADVVDACRPHVRHVHEHLTTGRGDATRRAASAVATGVDVVVAVGGDGTVGEVVTGLLSAGAGDELPALLIVPAGTGNSSHLAQWGHLPWPETIARALRGDGSRRRLFDVGRLVELDELVLLGACSGMIAEALIAARSVPVGGRERYRIAMATTAAEFVPYPGRVIVDGTVVHTGRTVFANVGGGRYRGGTYLVLPRSELDDGLLDVCVIGDALDPVRVLDVTRTGEHLTEHGVCYARGRRIIVERTDGLPLSFERDGELRTSDATRFTVDVLPNVLPVLCRDPLPSED